MIKFKDFLDEQLNEQLNEELNEAAQPFGISVELKVSSYRAEIKETDDMAKSVFGENTKVKYLELKFDKRKDTENRLYLIVPEDKSTITKQNVEKMRKLVIGKVYAPGFDLDKAVKLKIEKREAQLQNVDPRTPEHNAYKKAFSKTGLKPGQQIKIANGVADVYFTVDNLISNTMVLGTKAEKSRTRGWQDSKALLLIKDVGAFTEYNVPEEYKKYM